MERSQNAKYAVKHLHRCYIIIFTCYKSETYYNFSLFDKHVNLKGANNKVN